MDIASAIVIFIMVWWVIFFTVLPWGVEAQGPVDNGGLPAAPRNPRLRRKMAITTAIALVVSAVVIWMVQARVIDFRGIADHMMEEDLKK